MVLWLVVLIPTIDLNGFFCVLRRPASYIPISLFLLAVIGMFWADADWPARLQGLSPVSKFLFLPLLLYHFARSQRVHWLFFAFIGSCSVLLVFSWIVYFEPALRITKVPTDAAGVPVRNYIDQTQEFALCIFGLAATILAFVKKRMTAAAMCCGILLLAFVSNLALVTMARTALLYAPVLTVIFAVRFLPRRFAHVFLIAAVALASLIAVSSPNLRHRIEKTIDDFKVDRSTDIATSQGLRLFYWHTALKSIAEAPIIGHGTGSTGQLFAREAHGKQGAWSDVVRNPHNQMLYVAVQWGMIGTVVLLALWYSHFELFTGRSVASWIGLTVVIQNILSSLLNSHLFDFHEGWLYVFGVGAAGGAVRRLTTPSAAWKWLYADFTQDAGATAIRHEAKS